LLGRLRNFSVSNKINEKPVEKKEPLDDKKSPSIMGKFLSLRKGEKKDDKNFRDTRSPSDPKKAEPKKEEPKKEEPKKEEPKKEEPKKEEKVEPKEEKKQEPAIEKKEEKPEEPKKEEPKTDKKDEKETEVELRPNASSETLKLAAEKRKSSKRNLGASFKDVPRSIHSNLVLSLNMLSTDYRE
jgi:hypothetical protein